MLTHRFVMLRQVGLTALAIGFALPCSAQSAAPQASGAACGASALTEASPAPRNAVMRDSSRTHRDSSVTGSTMSPAPAVPSEHGTIVLYASASAREVRFAAQPRIVVRLCGAVSDSVHVLERRNLPERVQPGTTYRDVYIAVEIIGHLDAQCLAQRIGVAQPADAKADCASVGMRDTARATPVRPPQ